MEDLSLHILDVVENSITAGAKTVRIQIREDTKKNRLTIRIVDNGRGMDKDMLKKAVDPFFTTKDKRRIGLGLSLLGQAAQQSMGGLSITSKKSKGTSISARFQYDHIDRKPLGNIEQTMVVLIAGNPEINFVYEHKRNSHAYRIDIRKLRKSLTDIPINHPKVIKYIKDDIRKWLNDTKNIIV
jgi:anti-sigma regulatory factor (Ser/Thr protein kinase)